MTLSIRRPQSIFVLNGPEFHMHHVSIALALALSAGVAVVSLSATLPLPRPAEAKQSTIQADGDSCLGYIRLHMQLKSTEDLEQIMSRYPCSSIPEAPALTR